MVERDAFIINTPLFAADTQGGDDIVCTAQCLMRIAGQAEGDIAANTLEYPLSDGTVDGQFMLIGVHKHHFSDADTVGVVGDRFGQERRTHAAAAQNG
ncbi:hypothetical protein D3C75_904160 [compost metagenome]